MHCGLDYQAYAVLGIRRLHLGEQLNPCKHIALGQGTLLTATPCLSKK
jgi:hypothetical protein